MELYLVRMRENTDQKKLSIWTLYTQCFFFCYNSIFYFNTISLVSKDIKINSKLIYIDKLAKENTISTISTISNDPNQFFITTINPFTPNGHFLYPLKRSEILKVFWCFQGVEKGCIGKKYGLKQKLIVSLITNFSYHVEYLNKEWKNWTWKLSFTSWI